MYYKSNCAKCRPFYLLGKKKKRKKDNVIFMLLLFSIYCSLFKKCAIKLKLLKLIIFTKLTITINN